MQESAGRGIRSRATRPGQERLPADGRALTPAERGSMPSAQAQQNGTARGKRKLGNVWQPWPLLTQEQLEASPSFRFPHTYMTIKAENKLREAACVIIGKAGMPNYKHTTL